AEPEIDGGTWSTLFPVTGSTEVQFPATSQTWVIPVAVAFGSEVPAGTCVASTKLESSGSASPEPLSAAARGMRTLGRCRALWARPQPRVGGGGPGGGGVVTVEVGVAVAVTPCGSVAATVTVREPAVEVSTGVPLSALPWQLATPAPPLAQL